MSTTPRYYAAESRTYRGSWNVYDRNGRAPEGGPAVEIAHETEHAAKSCADSLNQGKNAYAWLPTPDHQPGCACAYCNEERAWLARMDADEFAALDYNERMAAAEDWPELPR